MIINAETATHSDQMIEGLILTLRSLIPSVSIQCGIVQSVDDLKQNGFTKKGLHGNTGLHYGDGVISIWFDLSHGRICLVHVNRKHVPLTQNEANLLGRIPDALNGILVSEGPHALELAQRIAARLSLSTLLVARYLRGGHASTYWTPVLILEELQSLTYRRYEGHPCTSGFVYTSKPDLYIGKLPITEYRFIPFDKPIKMKTNKLESPASFRYVDGRNAFYLIDNGQKIHGFFIATKPDVFNLVDRCSCLQILPLVKEMPGRVWAAFVGRNQDVNVVASGNVHLRWDGNLWRLRDNSILTSLLIEHGCLPAISEGIAKVCFALSDLRSGTVLLIPNDCCQVPDSLGSIDNSDLSLALRSAFLDQSFSDLVTSNSIMGILSSDGLTTISKEGKIIACGEIVDISKAAQLQPTGGGRTHAAIAASSFGLAIKVSEDGPISVFKHGEQIIKL